MSVSVGDSNQRFDELALILSSNESVQDRIRKFMAAKQEADAAFLNLRIGNDAKAAYDDANAKHAEVEKRLADANAAADEAIRTVSTARNTAATLVADAEKQRTEILKAADTYRSAAVGWIEEAKTQATATQLSLDAALAAAQKRETQAAKAMDDAVAAQDAADAAKAEAVTAQERARAAEAKAKGLAAKLAGMIGT